MIYNLEIHARGGYVLTLTGHYYVLQEFSVDKTKHLLQTTKESRN